VPWPNHYFGNRAIKRRGLERHSALESACCSVECRQKPLGRCRPKKNQAGGSAIARTTPVQQGVNPTSKADHLPTVGTDSHLPRGAKATLRETMWSNERDGFDDGLALDTCTYIMLTVIWRESANTGCMPNNTGKQGSGDERSQEVTLLRGGRRW
jgi:hypothetical protein